MSRSSYWNLNYPQIRIILNAFITLGVENIEYYELLLTAFTKDIKKSNLIFLECYYNFAVAGIESEALAGATKVLKQCFDKVFKEIKEVEISGLLEGQQAPNNDETL